MKKMILFLLFVCPVVLSAQSYAMGDANHSGKIDMIDALMVAQVYVGLEPPGFYEEEGDVNCSGRVSLTDALMIGQYYVGTLDEFPCTRTPVPETTPTPPVSTGASDLPAPPVSGVPEPDGDPGNLEVLDWAGFRGAVSYTFDDSNSSQINNYQTLNNLNVRMTFYLQTNKNESSSSTWAQALNDGHELGNHTHSHQQWGSGSDVDMATNYIQQHFGVTPYTMAAPYGDNSYVSLAQSRFLLNRGVAGGSIAPNSSSADPFNLPSNIPNAYASTNDLNSVVSSARSAGRWQIFCIHGFVGGTDGAYQPIQLSNFVSHVNYVKSLEDVWIDSAVNVGAYWRAQKMFSSVHPHSSGDTTTYEWDLPDHFPPGKYLRVTVDGGTLMQDGAPLPWSDHGYYEIALDAGSLTLSP